MLLRWGENRSHKWNHERRSSIPRGGDNIAQGQQDWKKEDLQTRDHCIEDLFQLWYRDGGWSGQFQLKKYVFLQECHNGVGK